jgi:uncharacterized protein (UPF0333 family)
MEVMNKAKAEIKVGPLDLALNLLVVGMVLVSVIVLIYVLIQP